MESTDYKSLLANGWTLQVEIGEIEDGSFSPHDDDWADEKAVQNINYAVAMVIEEFGLPALGDWIHEPEQCWKVYERTFEPLDKRLTITLI